MDGFDFEIEVKRTNRRKSASISLQGNLVRFTVPKSLSEERIKELINKRSDWIKNKLKEQSLKPLFKPKEYVSGETFTYLGRNYRLKVIESESPSIKLIDGRLVAHIANKDKNKQDSVKKLLEGWYKIHAEEKLVEKTVRLSKIVGVIPETISIKNYKSRWGSCSSKGDITYNWRIILTPHHIIDYVVIHELCHMLEHNHSPKYWRHVEHHIPNWRDCRDWLKRSDANLFMR